MRTGGIEEGTGDWGSGTRDSGLGVLRRSALSVGPVFIQTGPDWGWSRSFHKTIE